MATASKVTEPIVHHNKGKYIESIITIHKEIQYTTCEKCDLLIGSRSEEGQLDLFCCVCGDDIYKGSFSGGIVSCSDNSCKRLLEYVYETNLDGYADKYYYRNEIICKCEDNNKKNPEIGKTVIRSTDFNLETGKAIIKTETFINNNNSASAKADGISAQNQTDSTN